MSKDEADAKVKERYAIAKEKGGFVEILKGRVEAEKRSWAQYANVSSTETDRFGFTEIWIHREDLYDEKREKPFLSSADRVLVSCSKKMVVSHATVFLEGAPEDRAITKVYAHYSRPLEDSGLKAEAQPVYRAVCVSASTSPLPAGPAPAKPN